MHWQAAHIAGPLRTIKDHEEVPLGQTLAACSWALVLVLQAMCLAEPAGSRAIEVTDALAGAREELAAAHAHLLRLENQTADRRLRRHGPHSSFCYATCLRCQSNRGQRTRGWNDQDKLGFSVDPSFRRSILVWPLCRRSQRRLPLRRPKQKRCCQIATRTITSVAIRGLTIAPGTLTSTYLSQISDERGYHATTSAATGMRALVCLLATGRRR